MDRSTHFSNLSFIQKLFEISNQQCGFLWTPYTDEAEESTFLNIYDGQPMPELPWKTGKPNLGRAGNNVLLHSDGNDTGLVDSPQYRLACTACNISRVRKLRLYKPRGRVLSNDFFLFLHSPHFPPLFLYTTVYNTVPCLSV